MSNLECLTKIQKREVGYYLSKVYEKTEQYELVIEKMKEISKFGVELSEEERNLLSIGFKQHVGGKRNSWRTIRLIEEKNVLDLSDETQKTIMKELTEQRVVLEDSIRRICLDFILLIDEHLVKSTTSEEGLVFFYKLKGDYFRYISEIESEGNDSKEKAKIAYEDAVKNVKGLSLTNVTRLGLFLNYSVFIHDSVDATQAIQVAQGCFEEAMEELDELSKDEYNDVVVILQLLRDNVNLWTNDENEEEEEEQ